MRSSIPNAQQIHAVFFDAGLTLIHSVPTLAERYMRVAAERGIATTTQAVEAALRTAGAAMMEAYKVDPQVWTADEKVRTHWRDYYIVAFSELGFGASGDAP